MPHRSHFAVAFAIVFGFNRMPVAMQRMLADVWVDQALVQQQHRQALRIGQQPDILVAAESNSIVRRVLTSQVEQQPSVEVLLQDVNAQMTDNIHPEMEQQLQEKDRELTELKALLQQKTLQQSETERQLREALVQAAQAQHNAHVTELLAEAARQDAQLARQETQLARQETQLARQDAEQARQAVQAMMQQALQPVALQAAEQQQEQIADDLLQGLLEDGNNYNDDLNNLLESLIADE